MRFDVQHRTELSYSRPISESVMEVRLTPRSDAHQTLRRFHLAIGPDARISSHIDWQGNTVHQFSLVSVHDRVVIVSSSTVETHPDRTDPATLTDPVRGAPKTHRLLDFLGFHGPVERDPRVVAFAERVKLFDRKRVVDAVTLVTEGTRDLLSYRKGVTTSLTSVTHALDQGAGVCQDFAHLGLALLRLVGVPCRYVSGYLYRPDEPEVESHAWCEAFVPSFGWLGFDPTHGRLVGDGHVAVAAGRSYADVPPNRGVFRGDAEERIRASVSIQPVADEGGVAPFAPPFQMPAYGGVASPRFGEVANLEQQQQQDRSRARVQQQRQQQQ